MKVHIDNPDPAGRNGTLGIVYRSSIYRQLMGYFPAKDAHVHGYGARNLIDFDDLHKLSDLNDQKYIAAAHEIADRQTIIAALNGRPFWDGLVHPTSTVASTAILGKGTIIGPYCYIGSESEIGDHSLVLSHCSIGDGCSLGAGNLLAPNTHLGNSVSAGNFNNFGISTIVNPGITINDEAAFGAGTHVNMNIEVSGKFVTSSNLKRINI